ncbi:hypothetical protein M9H77_23936 [Catharanthus roseus]|uniref:Uncharacterized protein n=1 Tax=Catharanthus roseus TaxID=4058 RepID=A0ACC0AYV2_CATRO|nr:hypothetical protein M9H77_23936 [Catharanthus roseus]
MRALPLKTLVEVVFNKLVKYFDEHSKEARSCINSFPKRVFDMFMDIEVKFISHTVMLFNAQKGIYNVKSGLRGAGRGNCTYALRMRLNSYTSEKWQSTKTLALEILLIFQLSSPHQQSEARQPAEDLSKLQSPWVSSYSKVHGSLARAGKVRGQTPKVAKQDKKKKPRGRAHKRMQYNRRFVTAVVGFGKKRGPNSSEK